MEGPMPTVEGLHLAFLILTDPSSKSQKLPPLTEPLLILDEVAQQHLQTHNGHTHTYLKHKHTGSATLGPYRNPPPGALTSSHRRPFDSLGEPSAMAKKYPPKLQSVRVQRKWYWFIISMHAHIIMMKCILLFIFLSPCGTWLCRHNPQSNFQKSFYPVYVLQHCINNISKPSLAGCLLVWHARWFC